MKEKAFKTTHKKAAVVKNEAGACGGFSGFLP
jgi:hypothetical protein